MEQKSGNTPKNSWGSLESIGVSVAIITLAYMLFQDWFNISVATTAIITGIVLVGISIYLWHVKNSTWQTIAIVWLAVGILAILLIVVFPRTMKIEGHVVNDMREPIPGIEVVLHDKSDIPHVTHTNSEGAFIFRDVPTGPFSIENPNMVNFSIATTGVLIRSQVIDIIANITPVVLSTPLATKSPSDTPAPLVVEASTPEVTAANTPSPVVPTTISETGEHQPPAKKTSKIDKALLVYVPEGHVMMGASLGDTSAQSDEKPQHKVLVSAFWVDKYEVTNKNYKKCIDAGKCAQPLSQTEISLEKYDEYPVRYVTWYDAKDYCEWAGRRLLTEVEWERAARGDDARIYPWGNIEPNGQLANFCDTNCPSEGNKSSSVNDKYPRSAPVTEFAAGESPFKVQNMAGNVREWVSDWYDASYYDSPEAMQPDPLGPDYVTGKKVVRGGSWASTKAMIRASNREAYAPDMGNSIYPLAETGIRCGETYIPNEENKAQGKK